MKDGQRNRLARILLASMTGLILAACGGDGDADTTPKASVSSVKIFGDSLMDSGALGYRFTIQSNNLEQPLKVFPERIAESFGFSNVCPFFKFDGTNFTSDANCTNFAVAGGRVNNLTNPKPALASSTLPFSILFQLEAASAGMSADDLVIIDGGANDLADIASLYPDAINPDSANGFSTYKSTLTTLLSISDIDQILGANPDAQTIGAAGGAYAQKLASNLASAISSNVIDKGVKRVVVVNATDITITPRFQVTLGAITQSAGSASATAFRELVQGWTQAFNTQLADSLKGASVQIYDLYAESNNVFNNPSQFGLRNVTTPACPVVANGIDAISGLADLMTAAAVAACNDAALSATIPSGETDANWWQSYAFSDQFHPSPALHKLIAQSISVQLVRAGWL